MAYVRAKKSRRRRRVNTTKPALKRKKKDGKFKLRVQGTLRPVLEKAWDQSKTMKENFHDMGLALNPNNAVPFQKAVDKMETEVAPETAKSSTVVSELEGVAACGEKLERHVSPGEVQFITYMTEKHGTDYKAMARDKRNVYQQTPKQIKRKIEAFLCSRQYQMMQLRSSTMEVEDA